MGIARMFRRLQSCNNVEDMRQLAKQRLPHIFDIVARLKSAEHAGGTVTVMTDVTEQKQAERDLMQERDGLRVLIDLTKQDKSEMIAVLEEVLSQLKN